jgi:hypothetical protein
MLFIPCAYIFSANLFDVCCFLAQTSEALRMGWKFFLRLFWYLDPSVLTTVSVTGLIATLVDYLVPTLTASICHPENWTGSKERKLEEICRGLANIQAQAAAKWAMFYDMRHSRPKAVCSNPLF